MKGHISSHPELPAGAFLPGATSSSSAINSSPSSTISTGRVGNKLTIKGNGPNSGNFAIDLDKVRSNVQYLRERKDERVDQLNPVAKGKLSDVMNAVDITKQAGVYDHIYDIVRDVWSGVTDASPATVGSYFVGCSVQSNFSGNHACSATCAGSITPNPSTPGWVPCQSYSILFDPRKNEFITLNSPDSRGKENAYIFVENTRDFRGFNNSDVSKLKGIGVKNISVVKYTSDGHSYTDSASPPISLDALLAEGRAPNGAKSAPQGDSKVVVTNNGAGMFIFLILLIIIIIIVAFLLLRSGRAI